MRQLVHMCTKLPQNILDERWRWIKPIAFNKEIKLKEAAKAFPFSQRTLERWVADYKKYGKLGLLPRSTRPKSQPNETPIRIKEKIIELRKNTGLCAKKINYKLSKEGIKVSDRLVGKVLKTEGLTRRYRTKKLKYKYIKVPLAKGDLVEIDVKYVPSLIENKQFYQFTAIDCASRWRYMQIYDTFGNEASLAFLHNLIKISAFRIRAIKTDNGANFTNRYTGYLKSSNPDCPRMHPFDLACQRLNIIHYLIDPGKPNQNGKVERSHRTDQEMFYDKQKFNTILDLKLAIKKWNKEYNNLEHCSLGGKTPNEILLIT